MDIETVGTIPAQTAGLIKAGHETIAVAVGQSLKIETSQDGAEFLNIECPAGKAWSVKLDVTITETDA